MDIRFGNYKQFAEFFMKAPRNVQKILFKAYPDYAAKLASDYMNSIKKVKGSVDTAKETIKEGIKAIPIKPKATSTPNKNLDSAFDTLYGKGKQEVPKAKVNTPKAKVGKGIKIGKGGGVLAAAQALINMNDPDRTGVEKLRDATMLGTGVLGLASANPWLLGTAGALAIGDALAKPVGNAIGGAIARKKYGKEEEWFNPDTGILDITTDLKGNRLSPEDVAKIQSYNDKRYQEIANQYGQAMVPFGATSEQTPVSEQSGEIPNNYNNQIPSSPVTQVGMGFVPQNVQNAQQGGLNNYRDILQGNAIQPALNPIVEPVNYSNAYSSSQGDIINQLQQNVQQPQVQGVQKQMVQNNDPYNIGDIRGKEPVGINYGDILNQYKAAMSADRRQNMANAMLNAFANQGQRPPIYYVSAKGDLNRMEVEQPSQGVPLPTNTSSNVDQLKGQLAIQQAQYQDMLAQQKYQQDLVNAQIAREDMINQANALAERFGGSPYMYMNKDIIGSLLKETINPNIQSQANIQEAIGKAPTQALLKAAEQRGDVAGELDKIQLGKQYDAMIANINNNAKLVQTELEQNGLDRRTAATIANQAAMNEYTQLMENLRAGSRLENELELQRMKGTNAKDVANIYASRQTSGKQPQTQEDIMNEMLIEGVKSGVPIPQLLKYIELIGTNKGLTSAEDAELNR